MIRTLLFSFMAVCFGFTIIYYFTMFAAALMSSRFMSRRRAGCREAARDKVRAMERPPGVSIVMPAYNEEAVIVHTVNSALCQDYPTLEVLIVNDGSKDDTLQNLIDTFEMEIYDADPPLGPIPTKDVYAIYRARSEPRLIVVDKAPSGAKADNSNVGINLARHPYVVVMDADEFMERDVISRCMTEVIGSADNVVAVGTSLFPANNITIDGPDIVERRAPTNYWVGCQLIEYITAFFIARPGYALIDSLPIISGGFGLFSREALVLAGGYQHGHLGEDMDMCLRVHRAMADRGIPYRIAQVPEAIVWTEFPPVASVLRRQRIRWHRGLKMIMDEHAEMFGRKRYGGVGTLGMGTMWLFEWIGPLLEAAGWFVLATMIALGWAHPLDALGVFLVAQFLSTVLSAIGVMSVLTRLPTFESRRDMLRMIGWMFATTWGYRQLTLVWRIRSLFPGDTGWGEMPRAGFKTAAAS